MSTRATPYSSPGATPSLGWFVSLSVLLHLLLLWGIFTPQLPLIGGSGHISNSSIAVHIQNLSTPTKKESKPQPVSAKPAVGKMTTAKRVVAKRVEKRKPQTEHLKAEAKSEPLDATMQTETLRETSDNNSLRATNDNYDATLQQRLRITLQQALADHFTYPLLARRRGWQGEVVLSFRLEADGRILDARIARSSGYGVLDHAALTALGKVKRLERGPSLSFNMELPVIYRLEG